MRPLIILGIAVAFILASVGALAWAWQLSRLWAVAYGCCAT